ncbi:Adenosine monophosphate-protein transferase SoFic (plasmid) [Piscirickettsia salmonis]|uniref:Fic family protein n=1 Tax=Piscirickettsia salmonis TaxID=1238 RepID=UPI0012B7B4A7|nr:Fic family protein [Piscirickettsia salmonis]QGP52280.1 Adenosine monophosphate-protein transferase SoFic [Piscirickettsia salmonis]
MNFDSLDRLKSKLDSFRPLPPELVRNLHEDLILRWTYNSNAIEGNTLTLLETKVVLEGITIGGKTLREHFEAINHKEAILFIEELVQKNTNLSLHDLKAIHQLILKGIDDKNAGRYRTTNVIISGASHTPPEHYQLDEKMEQFIDWYKTEGKNLHPVERAARVHIDFVGIHPFIDGNGRTSRLLTNFELMKDGYPAIVIPVNKRIEYYTALDLACGEKNYDSFINFIVLCVEESFKNYFYALGIN